MGESDKVFYGNMCFICHRTVKEVELKNCGSCKSIFYCSETHQKIHWKEHIPFCTVIQKINLELHPENIETNSDWYAYRTKFLLFCELIMGRKLLPYEINMILFPNNCQICHKRLNLQACLDCLCVNYCSDNHKRADWTIHKEVCHLFALCLELDIALEKSPSYPDYSFREEYFGLEASMADFIRANIVPHKKTSITATQDNALISELVTCPLSLLFATSLIDYKFKENTVLHVVGCSYLETASLKCWELLLHIKPHIKKLNICFIGPDVTEPGDIDPCYLCQNKLKLDFVRSLYHDYISDSTFRQPDVICTFNCGYHEYENSDSDTWYKTLPFLISHKNVPLIFTSFTEGEADRDMKRLLSQNKNLRIKIMKNKFCSLRPYRDLEKLGVYFNNEYIGTALNDS